MKLDFWFGFDSAIKNTFKKLTLVIVIGYPYCSDFFTEIFFHEVISNHHALLFNNPDEIFSYPTQLIKISNLIPSIHYVSEDILQIKENNITTDFLRQNGWNYKCIFPTNCKSDRYVL